MIAPGAAAEAATASVHAARNTERRAAAPRPTGRRSRRSSAVALPKTPTTATPPSTVQIAASSTRYAEYAPWCFRKSSASKMRSRSARNAAVSATSTHAVPIHDPSGTGVDPALGSRSTTAWRGDSRAPNRFPAPTTDRPTRRVTGIQPAIAAR